GHALNPDLISRPKRQTCRHIASRRMRVDLRRWERIGSRPFTNNLTANQQLEASCSVVLIEIPDRDVVPSRLPLVLKPGSTLVLPCAAGNRLTAGRGFPWHNLLYVVSVQLHGLGFNSAGVVADPALGVRYS